MANCLRGIIFKRIANEDEIPLRFGHSPAINAQEGDMHPISGKRFFRCDFALSDLVLVMRKLQVVATGVNINCLTEMFHCHRRAFDMPPRPSFSPRAIPPWLGWLGALPEIEITRVFLPFIDFDARPCK